MYRPLEYWRGISGDDVRRLRATGIRHTNQLLHRTSPEIDRARLSKRTGITTERLLGFAHQCTLMEVSGMERHLQTIRRFGVETMKDLRAQDADDLHKKLADAVGLAGAPRPSDVHYWTTPPPPLALTAKPNPTPPL